MLTVSGLAPSKGEARRLIAQGGVVVNNEKVGSIDFKAVLSLFESEDGVIVKKGKKTYHRFVLSK